MEIEIKIATEIFEIQQAKSIREKIFVAEQGLPIDLEFDDNDNIATHIIAIDTDLSKIIGTCRFFKLNNETCNISRLSVLPEYRGKNIAIKLAKFAENYAKNERIKQISIQTHYYLEKKYNCFGFFKEGKEFYINQHKLIRMTKIL